MSGPNRGPLGEDPQAGSAPGPIPGPAGPIGGTLVSLEGRRLQSRTSAQQAIQRAFQEGFDDLMAVVVSGGEPSKAQILSGIVGAVGMILRSNQTSAQNVRILETRLHDLRARVEGTKDDLPEWPRGDYGDEEEPDATPEPPPTPQGGAG